MRFKLCWLCILFFIAYSPAVHSETVELLRIYDGDTVKVKGAHGTFKLRLTGIDAPERNQAYGKKSRRAVQKICNENSSLIEVSTSGLDKYQRYLGRLYCDGIDVSLYLTQQGLAWHNIRYSNDINLYIAQIEARQAKIGLWQQKSPIPPWTWRRKYQRHHH